MMQHIQDFLQQCTTVTADGSLVSLDELEGLYVYWCSLGGKDVRETEAVLDELRLHGLETAQRHGVDYVEGLVLAGPVMADFILACHFTGAWGQPDLMDLAPVREVVTAS